MNSKILGAVALALVLGACGGKHEEAAKDKAAEAASAMQHAADATKEAAAAAAADAVDATKEAAADAAEKVEEAAGEAADAMKK